MITRLIIAQLPINDESSLTIRSCSENFSVIGDLILDRSYGYDQYYDRFYDRPGYRAAAAGGGGGGYYDNRNFRPYDETYR
jgi:hypothetical protein